jgi:hypothetical protein
MRVRHGHDPRSYRDDRVPRVIRDLLLSAVEDARTENPQIDDRARGADARDFLSRPLARALFWYVGLDSRLAAAALRLGPRPRRSRKDPA